MAGEINVTFRKGSLANVASEEEQAGQLLFAKYTDEFENDVTQGSLFFDFDNDTRIKMANDVDRARTLYAGTTTSSATAGAWVANITGVNSLYDGLTIALKINSNNSTVYNTLNVNNLGNKLVWYKANQNATDQIKLNSEVILTYRTDLGAYQAPSSGGPGTLTAGSYYGDGWILNNPPEKVKTLTLQVPGSSNITYDGSANVTAKLGTVITLKTWEAT